MQIVIRVELMSKFAFTVPKTLKIVRNHYLRLIDFFVE